MKETINDAKQNIKIPQEEEKNNVKKTVIKTDVDTKKPVKKLN